MKPEEKEIIKKATQLGIVNRTAVRNLKIKEEFNKLREKKKKSPGMKYKDAIYKLSEDYFLSPERIESIILMK